MKGFNYSSPIGLVNTTAFAVSEIVKAAKSEDATFNLFGAKIEEKAQAQSAAIKKDRVYSGLDVIDSARDSSWRDAMDLVLLFKKNPVKTLKEAAVALSAIFAKYGKDITKASYDDETAYLESAKTDFSTDSAQNAIQAIPGLAEILADVWAKNDEFKAQTAQFVAAEAVSSKSATVLKKEIVSLINGLVSYVDAVSLVRDDLKAVGSELESRIARANAAVQ